MNEKKIMKMLNRKPKPYNYIGSNGFNSKTTSPHQIKPMTDDNFLNYQYPLKQNQKN